jgi:hypothetical protein
VLSVPKETLAAAAGRARRTKKSAGRLLVSGLGFSAAYFFDSEHGKARRQQAWDLVDHIRRFRVASKSGPAGAAAPVPAVEAKGPPLRIAPDGRAAGTG